MADKFVRRRLRLWSQAAHENSMITFNVGKYGDSSPCRAADLHPSLPGIAAGCPASAGIRWVMMIALVWYEKNPPAVALGRTSGGNFEVKG